MKIQIGLLTLALLVGCAKEPAAGQVAAAQTTIDAAVSPQASGATGMGEVTSVDADTGTITISHGPIDALKWPAMTMSFKASPTSSPALSRATRSISNSSRPVGRRG